MKDQPSDAAPLEAPLGHLEESLIEEFLRARGHARATLHALPEDMRLALLRDASVYASAKLSEVESRAHLIHDLHDGSTE